MATQSTQFHVEISLPSYSHINTRIADTAICMSKLNKLSMNTNNINGLENEVVVWEDGRVYCSTGRVIGPLLVPRIEKE